MTQVNNKLEISVYFTNIIKRGINAAQICVICIIYFSWPFHHFSQNMTTMELPYEGPYVNRYWVIYPLHLKKTLNYFLFSYLIPASKRRCLYLLTNLLTLNPPLNATQTEWEREREREICPFCSETIITTMASQLRMK